MTLCAIYPGSNISAETCESGRRGGSTRNNDVSVKFNIRLRRNIGLKARTVNGGIEAEGLQGDLQVSSVNGSIKLSTTGRAEASTVNGSIRATIGATQLTSDLSFRTVNGSITVAIPDGLNADVVASAVGGRLSSDFALQVQRKRMFGELGSGGYDLNLKTVNGSVHLRRAN